MYIVKLHDRESDATSEEKDNNLDIDMVIETGWDHEEFIILALP